VDQIQYIQYFENFNNLNALIIGDVMIDAYIWGKVDRISPEAPVPIVMAERRENRLGGAANVARNIHALGARPVLCAVIGDDPKGDEFITLLEQSGMPTHGIIRSSHRITTTKFRVFGNKIQMLRVDEETTQSLSAEDEGKLIRQFESLLDKEKIDVVIFQDYDKGVITPNLIRKVVEKAGEKQIPVTVDPKKKNFLDYRFVTLFKPNLKELREGLQVEVRGNDKVSLRDAAEKLRDILQTKIILITLSEDGVFVDYHDGSERRTQVIPSWVRNVSDVSGAGDTVISVASLCLALGLKAEEVAFISNLAGGIVCEQVGVVPVDKDKLLKEIIKLRNH